MRGKVAKMLRKIVASVGPAKAERLNPTDRGKLGNRIVITFRYPDNSFQSIYKGRKRLYKKGNPVNA